MFNIVIVLTVFVCMYVAAKYIEVPNVCIANFVTGKSLGAVAKL